MYGPKVGLNDIQPGFALITDMIFKHCVCARARVCVCVCVCVNLALFQTGYFYIIVSTLPFYLFTAVKISTYYFPRMNIRRILLISSYNTES